MPADRLAGRTVLVTGASGFIGSTLVPHLARLGCRLRLASRRKPRYEEFGFEFVKADFPGDADWDALLHGIDVVFHLAAQTSDSVAEGSPDYDRSVNVAPVESMLASMRRTRTAPVVIFAGTETQAGLPQVDVLDDAQSDAPVVVYDDHKLQAERMLLDAAARGEAAACSLRLTTVYGPGPPSEFADRGVLNRMLGRALRGESVTVYGEGAQLRDYLYVQDAAAAFVAAAASISELNRGHYLVASGRSVTLREAFESAANVARELTGRSVAVERVEPPATLPPIAARSVRVDASRFQKATGWRATWSLEEGLRETARTLIEAER